MAIFQNTVVNKYLNNQNELQRQFEVLEKLPKPKGAEMPYVEGLFFLLLTGEVPNQKEVEELKKKFSKFETEEETKEEETKEELSKVKPIKHNPEAKAAQKKQVQFGKGKFNTTFDRVLNRLNK